MNEAKVLVRTNLATLRLKKNESIRKKLAELYQKIDFEGGDTFRIFEVNKYIKIILDEKLLEEAVKVFQKIDIVDSEKHLGELTIIYGTDITKTPGVFAFLSNELAANNVSIVDSTICHSEHLVILRENDLQKGFTVVAGLITKK